MEYRILRSRRKTLSIEITPHGEVVVRAPNRMTKRDILHFVEQKTDWISSRLARLEQSAGPILTPGELKTLTQQAKERIPPRVSHYASLLDVSFGRITIRAQHTRWGSCSAVGNLNFNCLLMLAPAEVLDYVIVHELCHRRQMNHSSRFWSEVERILPDYQRPRLWLKEHGTGLLARLPDAGN